MSGALALGLLLAVTPAAFSSELRVAPHRGTTQVTYKASPLVPGPPSANTVTVIVTGPNVLVADYEQISTQPPCSLATIYPLSRGRCPRLRNRVSVQSGALNDSVTVDGRYGDMRLRYAVSGGTGNDTLRARDNVVVAMEEEAGNDELVGGEFSDLLTGWTGGDVIRGGPGNDSIRGDQQNDTLMGDQGADTIVGGSGKDAVSGGANDDRIIVNDGEQDVVRCGTGRDRVNVGRNDEVADDCEKVF